MSIDRLHQVGITDPTLAWVDSAEMLANAPGVDPVTALLEGKEGLIPAHGFLVTADVQIGEGQSAMDLYRYSRDALTLRDPKSPQSMYGTGYVTADVRNGMTTTIVSGNVRDVLSEYSTPGYYDRTSGRVQMLAVGSDGGFVAASPAERQEHGMVHAKSRNPLEDDRNRGYGSHLAHLARVTSSRDEVIQIAQAVAAGAGLEEVSARVFEAKVLEQLRQMDTLEIGRIALARRDEQRGVVAAALVRTVRRLGVVVE